MKDIRFVAAGLLFLGMAGARSHGALLDAMPSVRGRHVVMDTQEVDSPATNDYPRPETGHSSAKPSRPPRDGDTTEPDLIDLDHTQNTHADGPQLVPNPPQKPQASEAPRETPKETLSPAATPSPVPSVGGDSKCRDTCIGLQRNSASEMLKCYTECTGKPDSLYVPTSIQEPNRASPTSLTPVDKTKTYSLVKSTSVIARYDESGSLALRPLLLPALALAAYLI